MTGTTTIRVIDFETTGIPGDGNDGPDDGPHKIVEIGWCDVTNGVDWATVSVPRSVECNPGRRIPPEASAIHHFTNEELDLDISSEEALTELENDTTFSRISVLAAHNSRFDRLFWDGCRRDWIDTYRCALRIWPNAPAHGNQVLRYWLGFDTGGGSIDFDAGEALVSHRASADAYVTAHILARMLDDFEVEQLVEWSSVPALLPRCGFGKHYGTPWKDVPRDYLDWIVRKSGMDDEDVLHTARHYLTS